MAFAIKTTKTMKGFDGHIEIYLPGVVLFLGEYLYRFKNLYVEDCLYCSHRCKECKVCQDPDCDTGSDCSDCEFCQGSGGCFDKHYEVVLLSREEIAKRLIEKLMQVFPNELVFYPSELLIEYSLKEPTIEISEQEIEKVWVERVF
jgi:hypothetical protein